MSIVYFLRTSSIIGRGFLSCVVQLLLAVLNLSVIIASLDATSPSRGGLGIRFIFRNDRLSAPKPASAARIRLCASRANKSEASDHENATACQGLPY